MATGQRHVMLRQSTPSSDVMGWELTYDMVGPRYTPTPTGTTFTTSYDGQVIEGLEVRDRINVLHDDVTIRDCRVRMTTSDADYHVYLPDGNQGLLIEYCELWQDYPTEVACTGPPGSGGVLCWGTPTPTHGQGRGTTPPVYGSGGGWTLRWSWVRDVSRGPLMTSNCVVEHNIIDSVKRSDHALDDDTDEGVHRSGLGASFGGDHCIVRNNRITSRQPQCSSSHSVYSAVHDWLIEGNYYTGGSNTLHFGASSNVHEGIIVRNNRWSSEPYPCCTSRPMGNFGPVAAWSAGAGSEWHASNRWIGTLAPEDPDGHTDGDIVRPDYVNV